MKLEQIKKGTRFRVMESSFVVNRKLTIKFSIRVGGNKIESLKVDDKFKNAINTVFMDRNRAGTEMQFFQLDENRLLDMSSNPREKPFRFSTWKVLELGNGNFEVLEMIESGRGFGGSSSVIDSHHSYNKWEAVWRGNRDIKAVKTYILIINWNNAPWDDKK